VQTLDASPGGTTPRFFTASFYKFVGLPDHAALQAPLQAVCLAHRVKGLVLLAPEGINGGLSGAAADVQAVLDHLRQDPRLADLVPRTSWAEHAPYHRMKVRLKKEIVTMGMPGVDPALMAGTYVAPKDWNALIADPDVVLIDTRNDYEVALGTFEGAINPDIDNFSQLPAWLSEASALRPTGGTPPKVAMFCTGGIRCEKSTALLRQMGFGEVFHLQGGILEYLAQTPVEQSRWQGECFVFDERVSVGHGLQPGGLGLCRNCRHTLNEEDQKSPWFELGVSCAHCHASTSEDRKRNARERQRQWALQQWRTPLPLD
jgi:UPF0176 protein